jgi:hypothetical protein
MPQSCGVSSGPAWLVAVVRWKSRPLLALHDRRANRRREAP